MRGYNLLILPDPLQISLYNGWLLIFLYYFVFIITLILLPKIVVKRLFDQSGQPRNYFTINLLRLPFSLLYFLLMIWSPMKLGSVYFYSGIILYFVGMSSFIYSLFIYTKTPSDQPVTKKIYAISRNPQWLSYFIVLLGTAVTICSWPAVLLLLIRAIFTHYGILAEEKSCLKKYGEQYKYYTKNVPRYLFF